MILALGCNQQGGQYSPQSSNFGRDNFSNDEKDEGPEREVENRENWDKEIQRFTGGFRTFPSSGQVSDFLNETLSGPSNPCEGFEDSYGNAMLGDGQIHPAAFGARKVLATMFQSCAALTEVIDGSKRSFKVSGVRAVPRSEQPASERRSDIKYKRKIHNTSAYVSTHPVLSKLKNDPSYPGDKCTDVTKRPPVYGYGSRKYPNKEGVINLSSSGEGVLKSSQPAAGIDCSAFISTALGVQGLKVTKSSGPWEDNGTSTFRDKLDKKNSCLKSAKFDPEQSVVPGDMINVSGSHIVMIDAVGDDPLGIKKYAASGNCDQITVKDFDFTYIHSGNINNSIGPSRVHISLHQGGTMWTNLESVAIKSCYNLLSKKEGHYSTKGLANSSRFAIMRHNTADPACVSDRRVKLKNEDCVKECMSPEEGKESSDV